MSTIGSGTARSATFILNWVFLPDDNVLDIVRQRGCSQRDRRQVLDNAAHDFTAGQESCIG